MFCREVVPLLSEFFDGVLDADAAAQVSQHLGQCVGCHKAFDGIAALHAKMRSLNRIPAPECLRPLVEHRITNCARDLWHVRLREGLERSWSRIRTLESIWYFTRALGTVMAAGLFLLIIYAIPPLHVNADAPAVDLRTRPDFGLQVGTGVQAKLGLIPPQPKGYRKPEINSDYFLKYSQSIPRGEKDVDFSVVAYVDPSGATEVQYILEDPANQSLLSSFINYISSAQCRPASKNVIAVASYLVLMYSEVSVYD